MKLPNFGYHFARWQGRTLRNFYRALLPQVVKRPVKAARSLDLSVFAYSNEEMLPEQIRSLRSFLRHLGRPQNFTIISDGSHTDESIRLLKAVDPRVSVLLAGGRVGGDFSSKIWPHSTPFPTAK